MDNTQAVRVFIDAVRASGLCPIEDLAVGLPGIVRFHCEGDVKPVGYAVLNCHDGVRDGIFGHYPRGIYGTLRLSAEVE